MGVQRGLDRHELGVHNVYPVPVSEPDLGVDLDHAPDGVVGSAQVQQVVVPQVPLAARVPLEELTNERQLLWLLTNERLVLRKMTIQRNVMRETSKVLTNQRQNLPERLPLCRQPAQPVHDP